MLVKQATKAVDKQSGGSSIKVCVRVRPFNKREAGEVNCIRMPTKTQTVILKPSTDEGGEPEEKSFEFDNSFWSHDKPHPCYCEQQTLMDVLGIDIITNAMDGFNNCLFAYGQTGSGKTHSVLGMDDPPEMRGLLPRIIEQIFLTIDEEVASNGYTFECLVSYLEIYNEAIGDLLAKDTEKKQKLEVRQHPIIGSYVPGLTEIPANNYEDVKYQQEFGAKARTVGATQMNAGSSRSHCIFQFSMDKKGVNAENGKKVQLKSRVNLVDLAGSERSSKTGAEGARLKEGAMINQSLTNLAQVITKLSEAASKKGGDFVPYRNSKLTHILQESLSGNSKTIMMAALSPAPSNYEETMGTLRFAAMCKSVVTYARQNDLSPQEQAENLKGEIEMLRALASQGRNPDVEKKLKESEELEMEMRRTYEVKAIEHEAAEKARLDAMDDGGLSFEELAQAFGLSVDLPKLVNISEDSSLSGSLLYLLETGVITQVGDNPDCRVSIQGIGVLTYMCQLFNEDDQNVMLTLLTEEGDTVDAEDGYAYYRENKTKGKIESRVLINGARPPSPSKLHHLDRLIIGWAHAFRVLIPADTSKRLNMRKSIMQACDVSIDEMLKEVCDEHQAEVEEVRAVFDDLKLKIDGAYMQNFIALFRDALPLVREGNVITSMMRPMDELRFQVEVSFNIRGFAKPQPRLVVRLYQKNEYMIEDVVDVWEFSTFKERLDQMRMLYHVQQGTRDNNKRKSLANTVHGEDPWVAYTSRDLNYLVAPLKAQATKIDHELGRRKLLSQESGGVEYLNGMIVTLKKELSERDAFKAELEGVLHALQDPDFCKSQVQSNSARQFRRQDSSPARVVAAKSWK